MAVKKLLDTSSAEQFRFVTVGQTLNGYVVSSEEFPLNGKMVRKHVFKTSKGLVSTLGSVSLNRGIDSLIKEFGFGLWVEITYTGNMKTKQPIPMKVFEFGYDETNRVSATALASSTQQATEFNESDLPSEEELADDVLEDEAPSIAPPSRMAATPAQVSKEQQSRVQNVLSRRPTR